MNFFAHGIPFLDDPYFVAGTAIPDWLCVADRPVRVRLRLIDQFLQSQNADSQSESAFPLPAKISENQENSIAVRLALGAKQHLLDDDWFHSQRAFIEVSSILGRLFRTALGPDDNFRAGFLGHIVTEMLLDRVLIERFPARLEDYYRALNSIDPLEVQAAVNQVSTRPTARLAPLIPRFVDERFLFDYLDERKMWFRLNQVMRRVKLPELPETVVDVLADAYHLVADQHRSLLPAHVVEAT